MTPERYQQIKAIFQVAVELAPPARAAYLQGACRGDDELRHSVDELLHEGDSTGLVDRPLSEILPTALAENPTPDEQTVGPYRLTRLLGKGGMGAVYEAWRADDQYRQQVAIKLIRRGMDSDFVVQRFRQERQILAQLSHTHIARLLDGGLTASGTPYLVMEFIEGMPIDEYCSERKLSVTDRLKLFCDVCRAVEYAHQNLVVHRDLKPSNILVTNDGVAKLLDFGIAKLVSEDETETALLTRTGMHLMTPEYAAPEQVLGRPITTAADVYSLGVVLYELLSGQRPFRLDSRSLPDVQRIIVEQEPGKPSTAITAEMTAASGEIRPEQLRRKLAGELDNIVLMALRKEPERRYASVEQLRSDIEAYLGGMPVRAQKSTVGYRAAKFLRRHRTGAAAAAAVLITLVAGIVSTSWQARVAHEERLRAERRFNDVRRLANAFLFDVHDSIQNLAGSTPARERIVKHARQYLDSLAKEAAGDSSLQRELAEAYIKLGDVQGNPSTPNLGDLPGALTSYQQALAILDAMWERQPDSPLRNQDASRIHSRIGMIQLAMGDTAGALVSHRKVLSLDEAEAKARPDDLDTQLTLASSCARLSSTLAEAGDTAGAIALGRRALSLRETLAAKHKDNAELLDSLATSYNDLGILSLRAGATADGIEYQRRALGIREQRSAARPQDAALRRSLAISHAILGDALAQSGNLSGALESVRRGLAVFERLAAADPKDSRAKRDLALTHKKAADLLTYMNQPAEAMKVYRRAVAIREDLVRQDPSNATWQRDLMVTYNDMGDTMGNPTFPNLGNRAGALEQYRRGLAIAERLAKDDANAEIRADLWVSYNKIGQMLELSGDNADALAHYQKGYAIVETLAKEDPSDARREREWSISQELLGRLLNKMGKRAEAESQLSAAVKLREKLTAADPANAGLRKDLALLYADLGDLYRSSQNLAKAVAWYERSENEWRSLKKSDVMLDNNYTTRAAEVAKNLALCRQMIAR